MTIHDPQFHRQVALEIEMSGIGAAHYRSKVAKDIAAERGYDTRSGRYILEAVVTPVGDAIKAYVEEVYSGRPGPKAVAAKLVKEMDPYVVAYLASRTILGRMMQRRAPTLLTLAHAVARGIELEARFTVFEESQKKLFKSIQKQLADNGADEQHKATVLTYAMGKYEIPWDRWKRTDMLHLGIRMVELFGEHTGLTEIIPAHAGGDKYAPRDQYLVHLTERCSAWVEQSILGGELLQPSYMPTVVPPKDWTGLSGGGYHTDVMHPVPLIRRSRREQQLLLKKADLSKVLSGLNAIQRTAWSINAPVLDVMLQIAKAGDGTAGLVPSGDVPMPERPPDIDTDPDVLRQWKWAARDVYSANIQRRQDRLTQRSLLDLAEKFRDERAIYFPHNLDFRGRAYPIPLTLQPQGADNVKALLRFSEGKPLGEHGARWLAIHGANCFGVDKVPFEDREAWVEENTYNIWRSAEDPLGNLWWTEADNPWSFLAFCFEWLGHSNSSSFVSHLPIALDGSCNGLQHFSAMLRDEVGGAAVNLKPAEKPQDIYQVVADRVMEQLRLYDPTSGNDAQKGRWAHEWLFFGIDRKVTKRPVMVLPYGGTPRSCIKYVEEAVMERIKGGQAHNFGDELKAAIGFLSSLVWSSIGDVVIAAREAMDWLQKVARAVAKRNLPMHWTTPSGFIAYQGYMDQKSSRIRTKIGGEMVKPRVFEDSDQIDLSKQATSISPNFVHSYDATAMILTVHEMAVRGYRDFAMIHDSYAVHAADTQALADTLRGVFVNMYQTNPLVELRDSLMASLGESFADEIPPIPDTGDLDLDLILKSDFFFA